MTAARALPLVLTLALALEALGAGAQAAPVVVLEGPATVELVDTGTPRRARLAIKPGAPKPAPDDRPRVLELSFGNLRDPGLEGALAASWELAPDGTPLALQLELKDAVRRPGTYRAVLAPLPKSRPDERVEFQINLVPAKLGLPEKLIVSRTLWWPLAPDELKPPLIIREDSRTTRLSALQISRLTASVGAVTTSTGLTPAAEPLAVAPGRQVDVPYSLDRGLPLGTITGKLRLSAPELADAATLDYEIRTRLSGAYIPVVIAIGFLLGWLVRKYLAGLIRLGEVRGSAARLLSPVATSLAERPDATFQAAVKPAWQSLAEARAGHNPDAIVAATTELDQKWRAALTDFTQRQVAAVALLDELRALAAPPLPLPASAAGLLPPARDAAQRARAALDRNDVVTASAELQALATLAQDLHRTALDWQDAMMRLVRDLRGAPLGLPAIVVKQFDERSASAPLPLDGIKATTLLSSATERRALFIQFDTQFREARNRLRELASRLESEWAQINQAVQPVRPRLPAFDALATLIAAFGQDVEAAADNPAGLTKGLSDRLRELHGHWNEALVKPAPQAAQTNLKTLADQREYLKLAQELVKSFGNVPLGGAAQTLASVVWSVIAGSPLVAAETAPSATPGARALPAPAETPSADSPRFVQSIILGGLYIAVYWLLNADTFGTQLSDLATLLVTSFGLDLGVEALLRLKK
jgi:hypothetical protein